MKPPEVEAVEHELFTFRRMTEQLPERVRTLFLTQLEKVVEAFVARDERFKAVIKENVDDAIFHLKLQEFDLEATRRERDDYKDRLDNAS